MLYATFKRLGDEQKPGSDEGSRHSFRLAKRIA